MKNLKKYIKYVIPLALGIKLGACIGWADSQVSYVKESRIERMAEDKSMVIHPQSGERYIIDFHNNAIIPYSSEELEKIERKANLDYLIQKNGENYGK